MSSSLDLKVFDSDNKYVAAFRYREDAALFVACLGEGASVRWMHTTKIWIEGQEKFSAGDSYDEAAKIMLKRIQEKLAKMKPGAK